MTFNRPDDLVIMGFHFHCNNKYIYILNTCINNINIYIQIHNDIYIVAEALSKLSQIMMLDQNKDYSHILLSVCVVADGPGG